MLKNLPKNQQILYKKLPKVLTKNVKKCYKITTKTNNTRQTNSQKPNVHSNVNLKTSCIIDKHMVSIAANGRNVDSAILSDQIKISNCSMTLNKHDVESKSVFTHQIMSSIKSN